MSQKQKTVLIVDDDEGMRDTLTAILKREFRVLKVMSGEAALPVLNRENVDLVLLDVRLPDGSGLDLVDEIAALPADRRPRIVIMSASVLPHEREAALASGANAFLGKPCRPADLVETIASLLPAGRPESVAVSQG